ncbi:MAG: GNAT family N-acetyltransferase [Chitinophagales bacterium]
MKIRKAKMEDIPYIVKMLADDPIGKKREDFQEPLPVSYINAFKNINSDPNQALMVVENDGKIIGTFQLSFIQYLTYQGGIRAQIEAVRIHKDFRGKGLGTQMFEWAIKQAKDRNAHVLQLTSDKKRPKAIHFYQSLGFTNSHEGMKLHLKSTR